MLRKTAIVLALICATQSSASAADQLVDPVRFDWSGTYLGLHAGYHGVDDEFADPPAFLFGEIDADGFIGGIHIGHNWVTNDWVYGIEADFSVTDIDDFAPVFGGGVFGRVEQDWAASLRARLGYSMDDLLVFATGGLVVGEFDLDYTFPTPVFGIGDQFSETMVGYTVGGGIEYAMDSEFTLRLEYRYSDYGEASGTIINCCAAPPNRQDHEITSDTVLVGFSRKF